ncbi:hypothetical protein BSKO_14123 [Bryopsis sp. KO-2023]|nr:hypothetical protein BSKO_13838 [Bryopsis sp. KO-2023]GMH46155.1 hypothetical protein BSKO_14123 [Bryopsis sp. KO-2023]
MLYFRDLETRFCREATKHEAVRTNGGRTRWGFGEETDGLGARPRKVHLVVQFIEMYEAENSVKERESRVRMFCWGYVCVIFAPDCMEILVCAGAETVQEALKEMKTCRTEVDSLGSQLAAMESGNANEAIPPEDIRMVMEGLPGSPEYVGELRDKKREREGGSMKDAIKT